MTREHPFEITRSWTERTGAGPLKHCAKVRMDSGIMLRVEVNPPTAKRPGYELVVEGTWGTRGERDAAGELHRHGTMLISTLLAAATDERAHLDEPRQGGLFEGTGI